MGAKESIISGNVSALTQMVWNPNPPTPHYEAYSGFQLRYCDRSSIVGNQAHGNSGHGIYLSRSSYCSLSGNVCVENLMAGMKLNTEETHSQFNSFAGNICNNNAWNGMVINAQGIHNSQYNALFGNMYRHNGAEGVLEMPENLVGYNIHAANISVENDTQYQTYNDYYFYDDTSILFCSMGKKYESII
jgi:parallel beta-helix repeat protein